MPSERPFMWYVCDMCSPILPRTKSFDKKTPQFRVPERFSPGRFDIWGSGHTLFHIGILCAMYTHYAGMMHGFMNAHTQDVCKLQGL